MTEETDEVMGKEVVQAESKEGMEVSHERK